MRAVQPFEFYDPQARQRYARTVVRLWNGVVGWLFSIGAYDGEDDTQRTKRLIFVVATIIATVLTIPIAMDRAAAGLTWLVVATWIVVAATPIALVTINVRPGWFAWVVNGVFALVVAEALFTTTLVGGLLSSDIGEANLLIIALAALMIFGRLAAVIWFGIYVLTILYAANVSNLVEPIYDIAPSTAGVAETLISMGIVVMAITLYFVRQRDRFQKESDDLLHNILPDEIATRLKSEPSMIADEFPKASVLFADVVGFTPMSAGMSPGELVGLLNSVFTRFDEFVQELGLEKIKTVGDEYMVAAGVPAPRPDHAEAVAELALRMRDHTASKDFDGHSLELRIGINSGPVVAGIIGTHKFSYDMWGDTVNTASRMESEGIPGEIQVSPSTYELLQGNSYIFEPRGMISIKGKDKMETYLLVDRHHNEHNSGAHHP